MTRQSPLILLFLVAYIFLPEFFTWLMDASTGWYKPFVIWLAVVIGAYFVQKRKLQKIAKTGSQQNPSL